MSKKRAKVISAKVEVAPSASCSVCGGNEDEDCIILCDTEGCKTETHMYCLIPPLFKVPDDNWYCENCSLSKNGAGTQQDLMNYFGSFSKMIIDLEPFSTAENYNDWLRDVQHQYSDLNSFLCKSFKTSAAKSEFDVTSPSLIGSLVKLFFASEVGVVYSGQCHTGRIVQRRFSQIGDSKVRWEHLVHFTSGGDGRKKAVLEWICLEEHACLVSCEVVWAKIDGFAVYWPCIKFYRSGVELSSGIANFYCGFDLLDSAASDDAGGNSSVGTTERKTYEQQSSSSAARVSPDYQLCQALLEDVFAFVSKSKIVPFLEKLRDSNSMTKRMSVAYALAWIEIEEVDAARRAYFVNTEGIDNLSFSGLYMTDNHERMEEEFDSSGNILAAICNAELKEYKSKGKKDSEGGDCSDSEGDHMPIEISNEIDDLQQVSSALRYIIDLVIQNNESIVSNQTIHTNCDDPEKLKHQKNSQTIAESISKHMDKLSSDCSSNKATNEIREILIQPELFDQVSALDKLLLQIDAGVQLFDSKNLLLSERVALCHYEKQPMEDNHLQKALGTVTVSPVSFHDLLISSYDCFRKEEEAAIRADLEKERVRQAEEKLRIAAEKKRQREDRKLFAKEEKLSYAIRYALEREARAKALERSRLEEEERKRKELEEEKKRQQQQLLLQEQKLFQGQEHQQPGTSACEHIVEESIPVPIKRKRGRKKKIVLEPLENNLKSTTEICEEQQQLQHPDAETQVQTSAVDSFVGKKCHFEPQNISVNDGTTTTELQQSSESEEIVTCTLSGIVVHDIDSIALTENKAQNESEVASKGAEKCELRFLSDIARENWIGSIVYLDDKREMGRVTSAESGWVTVRLVDGMFRRFRPYDLEEVDPTSLDFKTFEGREQVIESRTAGSGGNFPIAIPLEQKEDLQSSVGLQHSQSKSSTNIGDQDYLNMNMDSDLLICSDEAPRESSSEVIEEPTVDQISADELFQLFEERPMDSAGETPIPPSTEKFSYPDRKFVPLNQKPPKVKYLQFSLTKEGFEQKYKVSKPVTLQPKVDLKKTQIPVSQHGPTALAANRIEYSSSNKHVVEEINSSSSIAVVGGSIVSPPSLPVQKVNRPGSMSRNLRLHRNRDDAAAKEDAAIKFITIMNEEGDLVSVPEPTCSSHSENLVVPNSNLDLLPKQLQQPQSQPQPQPQKESIVQGQRLRRQQHILEQQRLAQLRQQQTYQKVNVDDSMHALSTRDERCLPAAGEVAQQFVDNPCMSNTKIEEDLLQKSRPSDSIKNVTSDKQSVNKMGNNDTPYSFSAMDDHTIPSQVKSLQTDRGEKILPNYLDPRLRLLNNRKVADPGMRENSLLTATKFSNTKELREDTVAQKHSQNDPVALQGRKRKTRFSHDEPVSATEESHQALQLQQWQELPNQQPLVQQQQEHMQHSSQLITPHTNMQSLQIPKRKSRFNPLPDTINCAEGTTMQSQTNENGSHFSVEGNQVHDNYNHTPQQYQPRQPVEDRHNFPVLGWENHKSDDQKGVVRGELNGKSCAGNVNRFYDQSIAVFHNGIPTDRTVTSMDMPPNFPLIGSESRYGIHNRPSTDEERRLNTETRHRLTNVAMSSSIYNGEFKNGKNEVAKELPVLFSTMDSITRFGGTDKQVYEHPIPKDDLPLQKSTMPATNINSVNATKSETNNDSAKLTSLSSKDSKDEELEDGEVIEGSDLEDGEVVEDEKKDMNPTNPMKESVVVQEFENFVSKPLFAECGVGNPTMTIIAPCLPPIEVMFGHSLPPTTELHDMHASSIECPHFEANSTYIEMYKDSTFQSASSAHNLYSNMQTTMNINSPLSRPNYVSVDNQTAFLDHGEFAESTPYDNHVPLTQTHQNMHLYLEGKFEPASISPPPPHIMYTSGPLSHHMDIADHPLPLYQNVIMEREESSMYTAHPSRNLFTNSDSYLDRQADLPVYSLRNVYLEHHQAQSADANRYSSQENHFPHNDDMQQDHLAHQFIANDFEPNMSASRQNIQWDSSFVPPLTRNSDHHTSNNNIDCAYPMALSNEVAPPVHSHSNGSHYFHPPPPPQPPRNPHMGHHSSQSQQLLPRESFSAPPPPPEVQFRMQKRDPGIATRTYKKYSR